MPISTRRARRAVYAVEQTANAKLGPVSATYVAQQSCPESCVFLHNGCYSENGFTGGNIVKPLNRGIATTMSRGQIAAQEANLIDGLTGERDLRLHVVGDSRGHKDARRGRGSLRTSGWQARVDVHAFLACSSAP